MALQEPQAEPSMEEILASIRRIISEDEPPIAAATPEPVLELRTPAPEPQRPAPIEDDILVFDHQEPAPPPVAQPVRRAAMSQRREAQPDPLVSEPAMTMAAGAFTRLAGSLRISDSPGQTVEGVVRELLRPMLREWLDERLPAIVEAKVEAELDRIARLAR